MIFLLDTDMLIYMIRGLKSKQRPAEKQRAQHLVERCRKTQKDGDIVGISALTVSELEFGARNSGNYDAEIAAVQKVLTPFDIFGFDGMFCPLHYGRVRHDLELKGQAIGSMDLLIAAHALALDATLVTNNIKHFARVSGLMTASW